GMKLFLSPNEKKTAAEVSEALGKTTKLSVSDSLSRDQGFRQKRSVSRRMEERPLMSPDEIRKLSADRVILIPERQNPIMAERIVYFQDPAFKALIDAQTGPLPYLAAESAEVVALRGEVAELRQAVLAVAKERDVIVKVGGAASEVVGQAPEVSTASEAGSDDGVDPASVESATRAMEAFGKAVAAKMGE
ncbi:MAG: type IV secretory system conjugative DNA transfer family protein, partial [Rhizobiaceae bacterium]|nr:type IV secretory system conjugative DNA transfer family protein [Rhizobiaceae bacterium]